MIMAVPLRVMPGESDRSDGDDRLCIKITIRLCPSSRRPAMRLRNVLNSNRRSPVLPWRAKAGA
jgi:hypothetical protein